VVERLFHEGALRQFHAALTAAAEAADDGARGRSALYARGLWLAAAEVVFTLAPAEAERIEAALAGTGEAALLPFAVEAVEAALVRLGG
jgi:hypothetical protein